MDKTGKEEFKWFWSQVLWVESSHVLVCLATDKQSSYAFWMISSQTAAHTEAVLFTVCFLSCMGVALDVVAVHPRRV